MNKLDEYEVFRAGYTAAVAERAGGGVVSIVEVNTAFAVWTKTRAQRAATARLTRPQREALRVLAHAGGPVASGPVTHVQGAWRVVGGRVARTLVHLRLARAIAGRVLTYEITAAGRAALAVGDGRLP